LAHNKKFADCGGEMFVAFMSLALGRPYASAITLHHHDFLFFANTIPLGLTNIIISGFLEQEISTNVYRFLEQEISNCQRHTEEFLVDTK
jgi:hypothetical protein